MKTLILEHHYCEKIILKKPNTKVEKMFKTFANLPINFVGRCWRQNAIPMANSYGEITKTEARKFENRRKKSIKI